MYRKILAISLALVILSAGSGFADGYTPKVGEVLEYKVIVKSMIYGADQKVKVISKDLYQEHDVVKVLFTMNTRGMVQSMTNYSEKEDLILDTEGLYPWYLKREVHDGDETLTEEVTFDYDQKIAVRLYAKNGSEPERSEIQLPGFVQDGLSLQFYFRRCQPGKDQQLYLYSNGKVDQFDYDVCKVKEPMKLDCGQFRDYYQLENAETKFTILVSGDQDRYPLVIRKIAKIGKIEVKLEKFR